MVACAQELQLPTAAAIRQDWESKGKEAGSSGLVPHRSLRVLARDLMTATARSRHEDPDGPPAAVTIVTTPSAGINRRELYEGELAARYRDEDELADEDVSSKGSVKRERHVILVGVAARIRDCRMFLESAKRGRRRRRRSGSRV